MRLEDVEHVLGSGNGVLDFAVEGRNEFVTWWGTEDAKWTVEDVERIENADEDRFIVFPEGEYFTCEIEVEDEGYNSGPVRCCARTDGTGLEVTFQLSLCDHLAPTATRLSNR